MAKYHCPKCQAIAHSKCAKSRNIFPLNQTAGILSHVFQAVVETPDTISLLIKIHKRPLDAFSTQSESHGLQEMATFLLELQEYSSQVLQQAMCQHRWTLDSETCDLGCCTNQKAPK